MIKKILYLLYFVKITDWRKVLKDIKYLSKSYNISKHVILLDIFKESLRTGVSFHEYIYYSWVEKNRISRDEYATMSHMYEYQKNRNPQKYRGYVSDKVKFLKIYNEYIGREWMSLDTKVDMKELQVFLEDKERVVLKKSKGRAGDSVKVVELSENKSEQILGMKNKYKLDLLEEYIYQHSEISKLSPNSVNTIRIITEVLDNNEIIIIGSVIRLGSGGITDNLTTGGVACPISLESGKISGPGISFDIRQNNIIEHPITKVELLDFRIPYWDEVKKMCLSAARVQKNLKSLGWDIAITESGPLIIEANHDWGARLWQMSSAKGMKSHLISI